MLGPGERGGEGSERGCRYITTGLHCKTKENKSHFDHMKAIVFKEESHVDVCVERVCTHDSLSRYLFALLYVALCLVQLVMRTCQPEAVLMTE